MKIINKIKLLKYLHTILYCFLPSFGFLIISWIIWARFLRERLPKDIPFELTEFRFYILLYICCIYIYIIYALLIPKKPNEFVTKFITWIYTPLTSLDEAIKTNKFIYPKYLIFIDFLLYLINKYLWHIGLMKRFYIICYIIPRTIIIFILIIDTFYFNKLEFIYKFIFIAIIPLIHRYLKYTLKAAKEHYTKKLMLKYEQVWIFDKDYETVDWELNPDAIHHNTFASIEEYIKIQTEAKIAYIMEDTNIEYTGTPFPHEHIYTEYQLETYNDINIELTSEDYDNLRKEFDTIMPKILNLTDFITNYSQIDNAYVFPKIKIIILKHIKILIFSLYFICWGYIIIKSFHTLEEIPITKEIIKWIIRKIPQNLIEPFSNLYLNHENK